MLVNGCYEPGRNRQGRRAFRDAAQAAGPLRRRRNCAAAEAVAPALAAATGLPPYQYTGPNALRVGGNPYVWARNLLANRLYECPVVYVEPYVMNSPEVFARVQAGDYEGTRDFGGVQRTSIFREYADAVADGLAAYYRARGSR